MEPAAGTLLVYTADDSNIHSVEEVTVGERSTLTMWFTLDAQHQEDTKVRGCLMLGWLGCYLRQIISVELLQRCHCRLPERWCAVIMP